MKYPYIGKCIVNHSGDFSIALLIGNGKGALLKRTSEEFDLYDFGVDFDEESFTNISPEYLEGKCVKIESPEHSELVQKLAFNAGFKWQDSECEYQQYHDCHFKFHSDGMITYTAIGLITGFEQITIPLPPKTEPKEWPQVGDRAVAYDIGFEHDMPVTYRGKNKNGARIVEFENGNVILLGFEGKIKKPKTEAEILRDELIELAFNQFNDDSHPLDRNAYYLISELMDKYNITKKPQ